MNKQFTHEEFQEYQDKLAKAEQYDLVIVIDEIGELLQGQGEIQKI